MSEISSILIVGGGQAGAVAAASLRDQGYNGSITIVGEEPHAPYERPPLSKDILSATADEASLQVKAADFYASQNIDLHLGVQVTHLDIEGRKAELSDGKSITFDRCLLATGGTARTLPALPEQSPYVHYLRTLDDSLRLRARLADSKHVIVIGGGFLGLEIASTAVSLDVPTTVIETSERILARAVPPEFSLWLQGRIARSGVDLELGQGIASIDLPSDNNGMATLVLDNGIRLQADTIVVAIGLTPSSSLAQAAGIKLDKASNAIIVDELCKTSAPNIFAAGDCTSLVRNGQSESVRLESWQNANEQARIAVSAMLGQPVTPAAFPWFWTDQFGCNIQMLGLPVPGLTYILRADSDPQGDNPSFIMLGMQDNKPYHALAVNSGGNLRALRPVLERALPIDADQFVDTSVAVRAFAKAAVTAANAGH